MSNTNNLQPTAGLIYIDRRDLVNLMRHAYCMGINQGLIMSKTNGQDPYSDERDVNIADFIDQYIKDGYMSYNRDLGTHICEGKCGD